MLAHPSAIKRPVVETLAALIVGVDAVAIYGLWPDVDAGSGLLLPAGRRFDHPAARVSMVAPCTIDRAVRRNSRPLRAARIGRDPAASSEATMVP